MTDDKRHASRSLRMTPKRALDVLALSFESYARYYSQRSATAKTWRAAARKAREAKKWL